MTATNVVYRYVPDGHPRVQFYSMPDSVLGGGSSLADARAVFESALATEALPTDAVEHTEVAAAECVFVRMRLGDDQDGRIVGLNEVKDVVGTVDAYDQLSIGTAASGDVIVVVAQPTDTIGDVLDQMMTPHDSLWLALRVDGGRAIDFVAIRGGLAEGVPDPSARLIDPLEDRSVTLAEIFGRVPGVPPSKQLVLT